MGSWLKPLLPLEVKTSDDLPASVVSYQKRIPCLDGLRGVASLMILVYHFGPHIIRAPSPFLYLQYLTGFFSIGVDLFFVLSGFLITGILFNVKKSKNYYTTFYTRRALRLLPIYYVVCFSYFLLSKFPNINPFLENQLFQNPLPIWTYFFHVQNFAMSYFNVFGPIWLAVSWSLAIEEQFYLVLPVIVRNIKVSYLWKLGCAAFIFSLAFRGLNQKYKFMSQMANYVMPFARMDSLALGALVAYAFRYEGKKILSLSALWPRLTIGVISVWIFYCNIPFAHHIRLHFIHHSVYAVICALLIVSLVLHPNSLLSRFLSTKGMRRMGEISYSMYLFHPIALSATFFLATGRDPHLESMGDWRWIILAVAITLLLCQLSWTLIEKPMQRIGQKFFYRFDHP